jgi:NAD(P)-dependent dehydrogenase (short-subunit alcohol dehydrogenase family)
MCHELCQSPWTLSSSPFEWESFDQDNGWLTVDPRDALVSNAAIVRHTPLRQWKVDVFDEHFAVNVRVRFLMMRDALLRNHRSARLLMSVRRRDLCGCVASLSIA